MSEDMTRQRWPLYLALAALGAAFVWVFLMSIERAKAERSIELTLEPDNAHPVSQDLQLTSKLGTLPALSPVGGQTDSPANGRRSQPAPWWPALLFGLAFLCGWLYRHERRPGSPGDNSPATVKDRDLSQLDHIQGSVINVGGNAHASSEQSVPYTTIRASNTPDLDTDFPWDESLLDDTQGLSGEERITLLEKQNASKVEIIKALERLVTENREKWLHQDETESRLNTHIQTLSDDLRVAIGQLHRLQANSPSATGQHKKVI